MWTSFETCLYRSGALPSQEGKTKIAAFDMDSTLILANNGAKYSTDVLDYVWCFPNVIERLQSLHMNGFTITIFSNRRGSPQMNKTAQKRVDDMITKIGVPLWTFFATKQDQYRKPEPGMFNLFLRLIKNTAALDPQSFYCGDAAGPDSTLRWNRWSDIDQEYSKRINVLFVEPQNLFDKWSNPTIPPESSIIITCGQEGSGWEVYKNSLGSITPLSDGRQLIIVDDDMVFSRKPIPPGIDVSKGQPVYMILGKHAMVEERVALAKKLGPYVVYLYCRSSHDESMYDKNFPKVFSLHANEKVIRCN